LRLYFSKEYFYKPLKNRLLPIPKEVTSNLDPLEINYSLKRMGISQSAIARELGVSTGIVSNVVHGRTTSHFVASHIAHLLGLEISQIWPSQYIYKPRKFEGKVSPIKGYRDTKIGSKGGSPT
jgi:Ner family transcriptional regulator